MRHGNDFNKDLHIMLAVVRATAGDGAFLQQPSPLFDQ